MILDHPRTSPSTRLFWLIVLAVVALLPLLFWEWYSNLTPPSLTPELSHPSGYYDEGFRLTLQSQPDATILYTFNGEPPTAEFGEIYQGPLSIIDGAGVVVVRSRAISKNGDVSQEKIASYFVGVESTLPLVSITTDPANLWNPEMGIVTNPFLKGQAWERPAHLSYVDVDRISTLETQFGLRIHGGVTRRYEKKSFRLYFRDDYGESWLTYRLFPEHRSDKFKRLVLHSGGQDSLIESRDWSLIRNQLISEIAFEIGGFATHSRPVLLFINGDPWGIYLMRERIDEHFLQTNFNIENGIILDTPAIVERGKDPNQRQWDDLIDFVEANDISDPDNYDFVRSQIDIDNYIDYNIVQMYSGNIDWPHHNVNLFRDEEDSGKWHWIFWDNDSSFALNQVSKIDENMVEFAVLPDLDGTTLLANLMENREFRQQFSQRAEFLLSTALAPDQVSSHIDKLAAELEPNLLHETGRWGSGPNWDISIRELHEFAEKRPDIMREHLANYFNKFPDN